MIQLGSAYGEIILGTGEAEKSVKSLAQQMRDVGAGLSLAISTPLIGVAAAGLHAAAGFEESMNLIQTVGGATAEQMQAVQSQALQLGKDTSFSAGEAADGFLELTKAGFDVESSMGAIGGVLDLAAAGNLSVASAAEIAANAINAFQLPASDAGRIADMLAAGANASSVEVTDLSDSLQMSGAVLGGYGQSLDDTTTALALMGNQGLKGSDAGTSLKQMFISLAAPTDKARKLMSSLGISIYDTQGNMLAMPEILDNLATGFQGMTEEQMNAAKATLFGSDGIRAANVLLSEGADGWDKMSRAVNKGGAASEVAASRQKGFNGAMEYFKGTMESLLIEVLLPFLDTLSGGLRWIADLVALFTKLPQPVQYAALAFLAVLAAIGPVLLALSGVATVLGFLLSPIGLIAVAVAALAAAWVSNWGDIQGKVKAVWDYVKPIFDSIVGWLQTTAGQALTFLQGKWNEVWPTLQGAVSTAWAAVKPTFIAIRDWVQTKLQEGITTLQAAWQTAWPAIQAAVSTAWTTMQSVFMAVVGWLAAAIPIAVGFLGGVWSTVWTALQTAVSNVWGVIGPIFASIGGWVKTNLPNALPTLQTAWSNAWTAIRTATNGAWMVIEPYLQSALDWVKTNLPNALPALQTAWSNAWTAIQAAVSTAWTNMKPTLDSIIAWLKDDLPPLVSGTETSWSDMWASMTTTIQTAQGTISAAWSALADLFGPTIDKLVESFQKMLSGFRELGPEFTRLGESAQKAFGPIGEILLGLGIAFGAIVYGVMIFGLNMLASAFEVLPEIVRTAANVLTEIFNAIGQGWQGTIDLVTALINGDWAGAWNAAGRIVGAVGILVAGIWNAVVSAVAILWQWMANTVVGTLEDMGVNVEAGLEVIRGAWDTAWEAMRATWTSVAAVFIALWTTVRQWLVWTLPGAVKTLQTKFNETWTAIKNFIVTDIFGSIIGVFESMKTWLETTLQDAVKAFSDFLDTISLPNPFSAIQGAIDAILSGVKAVQDAFNKLSLPTIPNPLDWVLPSNDPVEPSGRSRFGGPALAATGGITVNVTTGPINSQIDVAELAYEVARQIRIRL